MYNTLKRKLAAGKTTVGAWLTIPSMDVAEALSTLPLAWFVFDLEHAPLTEQTAQQLMQSIRSEHTTPLVRVAWNDHVLIKRALDIGSHGIVVPMVNTRADAERAVQACRYPPHGARGCGPRRPWVCDPDYLATADEELIVIVQIETEEAVRNLDEILTVEGVGAFFVGAVDLSFSMGFRGAMDDSGFQKAIDTIHEAGRRHGVASGIWLGAGKQLQDRVREGWQMIAIGMDIQLLVAGAKQAIAVADLQ